MEWSDTYYKRDCKLWRNPARERVSEEEGEWGKLNFNDYHSFTFVIRLRKRLHPGYVAFL